MLQVSLMQHVHLYRTRYMEQYIPYLSNKILMLELHFHLFQTQPCLVQSIPSLFFHLSANLLMVLLLVYVLPDEVLHISGHHRLATKYYQGNIPLFHLPCYNENDLLLDDHLEDFYTIISFL